MDKIKDMVKNNGLESYVCFLGYRNDVPKLLKLMDLFVLPSIFEGLPAVAVEAQAAGTPCLLSESVSPETDMKLDLCFFMPLDGGIELWCRKIKEMITEDKMISFNISEKLEEKCFTTEAAAGLYEKFIYNEIYHYEF
jgi:glycosyltransferase EpsF